MDPTRFLNLHDVFWILLLISLSLCLSIIFSSFLLLPQSKLSLHLVNRPQFLLPLPSHVLQSLTSEPPPPPPCSVFPFLKVLNRPKLCVTSEFDSDSLLFFNKGLVKSSITSPSSKYRFRTTLSARFLSLMCFSLPSMSLFSMMSRRRKLLLRFATASYFQRCHGEKT
ncbi:hypothetical protein N665_0033s0016 [Sinapis alba]|nr:hypothetical protein N665_0033s0016 [Sinapis alba]